jgi:hypothetical protein
VPIDPRAAAELDELLAHPGLAGRWPDGFTTDDVLLELTTLGRVRVDVPAGALGEAGYGCRLELDDDPHGSATGRGRTLTAAALRCLLDAEHDLRAAIDDAIERFGDLLGGR